MHNLDYFRDKLTTLKSDMSQRIKAIDKDIRHEGMTADWSEQAVERENDEVLDSLGNASENELVMINAALKRIDAGEYFVCSTCGGGIPASRLELIPFTATCVSCAEKNEN